MTPLRKVAADDLPRQAEAPPSRRCRRTRSASRAATTKARSRRCAPAAATIRSRRRSSRRSSSSTIAPHRVAKLSGIGCSSKTPTYFLGKSHGFNSVHGRMPSVLTGAALANRDLIYLGVSGDGDSASIGLGQFAHMHAARRQHGLHRREQRRLRPHQGPVLGHRRQGHRRPSAARSTATSRSTSCMLALLLGATFVARGFSGDKEQLVPLIKAAVEHKGAAFIDVVSPCVAFNNHPGSTKSYDYVREHNEAVNRLDFMPPREPITADVRAGRASQNVVLHDGGIDPPAQAARRVRSARQGRRAGLPRGASRGGRGRHRPALCRGRSRRHGRDPVERAFRRGAVPGSAGLAAFNAALA